MAALTWDDPGTRWFESGVEHVAFFTGMNSAVPWNGVRNIEVHTEGGELKPIWFDGVIINYSRAYLMSQVTIDCYTYPSEVEEWMGFKPITTGSATRVENQSPSYFHLYWKTRIGNDLETGSPLYKAHFLYNAVLDPITRAYSTHAAITEPSVFKFAAKTLPVWNSTISNAAYPFSYASVDSRDVSASSFAALTRKLEGTSSTNPSFPTMTYLQNISAI